MSRHLSCPARALSVLHFAAAFLLVLATSGAGACVTAQDAPPPPPQHQQQPPQPAAPAQRTPADTVREFYRALRERRFREAFALSIYRPAVEGLTAEEFEELRPEFEKMATAVPEQIEIGGEQISGDAASVFARVGGDANSAAPPEEIKLIRDGGQWIFGDRESQQAVAREGRQFFPNARISTHQDEVRSVLLKIVNAEAVYAAQHGGVYADVEVLFRGQPGLREDVEAITGTLGYTFRLTLSKDGRGYEVNAEPVRHGRTGLLSFYMDPTGIQTKDNGGKPFTPPRKK